MEIKRIKKETSKELPQIGELFTFESSTLTYLRVKRWIDSHTEEYNPRSDGDYIYGIALDGPYIGQIHSFQITEEKFIILDQIEPLKVHER